MIGTITISIMITTKVITQTLTNDSYNCDKKIITIILIATNCNDKIIRAIICTIKPLLRILKLGKR